MLAALAVLRIFATHVAHLSHCLRPRFVIARDITLEARLQLRTRGLPDYKGFAMAIARITGQGLTCIAVLVALLWACAIGERVIVDRANAETSEALREMRSLQLKNRRQPAVTPARPMPRRPRPELS